MASILGTRLIPPNQDGNEEGCFCNIKAKKIYAAVTMCGFTVYDPLDGSKPVTYYLRRAIEGSGEVSASGPSSCCADGNPINWSASTEYRVVDEYDPRTCKREFKGCSGKTQMNGSLGGHSGKDPCCLCYSYKGSYSGNFNGQASLSTKEHSGGEKFCEWNGHYTLDNLCTGGITSGDVTGPLTPVKIEEIYEIEYDYKMLEDLFDELFEKCKFDEDDFEWNQQRQVRFDEEGVATCGEPGALFQDIWDKEEEEYRCTPCDDLKILTVEFYTNSRKEEGRTLIQKAKAQFIPKTEHYWKLFFPSNYEGEKRDDFPIVCELVKAKAGEKIDIDPPEEPGYYMIMNCAETANLAQCMEKKNFPKIFEDA